MPWFDCCDPTQSRNLLTPLYLLILNCGASPHSAHGPPRHPDSILSKRLCLAVCHLNATITKAIQEKGNMSCLSSVFGCCLPSKVNEKSEAPTAEYQTPNSTTTHPSNPNPSSNHDINNLEPPQNGYNQVVPLPAYTPRPMSIREKTLEAHMRDPPVSNETYHQQQHDETYLSTDEKQHMAWEEAANSPDYYPYHTHPRPEDVSSDVSSAISFPSSYGNTSTATRETPPPPYSPRTLSPAPSRSMSISSAYRNPQMPMAAITQPPPAFTRPSARRSIDEQLTSRAPNMNPHSVRDSWESESRRPRS